MTMKQLEIVGKNYFGHWNSRRTACRSIVLKEGLLLLSYETLTGTWMLPGGGLEEGESEEECCRREVAEETGFLIKPAPCALEIDEYYENCKYISRYFISSVIGKTEPKLTAREKQAGMQPRWLPPQEAVDLFSHHADYAATDEMRRGLYLREYTALCELI